MIIIDVKESGGIEKALKILKSKFSNTKTKAKLRERIEYRKPSVDKRTKLRKAKYLQQKYDESNGIS